jgi:hypothetical protein
MPFKENEDPKTHAEKRCDLIRDTQSTMGMPKEGVNKSTQERFSSMTQN